MSIIEFDHFALSRGGEVLIEPASGGISAGDRIMFRAPNGAGKSTFISVLCGLDTRYEGSLERHSIAEPQLEPVCAILPEHSALEESLQVAHLIAGYTYALEAHNQLIPHAWDTLSDKLNLNELMKKPFGVLSKGERKRVMLGLCLITRFDLLILDEAFDGLDEHYRALAASLVGERLQQTNMALLATSHTELPGDMGFTSTWTITNNRLTMNGHG